MWHNNELSSTVTLACTFVYVQLTFSFSCLFWVLPNRREWLCPSQIILQIPLLLTCNVKQVAFCVGYINGMDVGDAPRLYVSFRGEENELASISVCECMCGVLMTSVALLDDMRLAAAIWWWKVALAVTRWNMCCGWEGEIAQHASHHCKHVQESARRFLTSTRVPLIPHRAEKTSQWQGLHPWRI